jgi:hypothetical protein
LPLPPRTPPLQLASSFPQTLPFGGGHDAVAFWEAYEAGARLTAPLPDREHTARLLQGADTVVPLAAPFTGAVPANGSVILRVRPGMRGGGGRGRDGLVRWRAALA